TLVQEAVGTDNYAAATGLLKLVDPVVDRSGNAQFVKIAKSLPGELAELQREYESTKVAIAALKKQPDDPAANLAVGKYLCLSKGDWLDGLPYLAKSGDATLKELAVLDLSR